MIRDDGTSTIETVTKDGVTVGTEDETGVRVEVSGVRVVIFAGRSGFTITPSDAWALRDVLTRTLDESACPAQA